MDTIKMSYGRSKLPAFMILVFALTACVWITSAHAEELILKGEDLYAPSENNKKHTLSICALFRNEASQMVEWIEQTRLQGVDHFYLYNVGSTDNYYSVLIPYINQGFVTLVNWPGAYNKNDLDADTWALSTQVPAFENAVNFVARGETKWLLLAEIGEQLKCPGNNIKELLLEYDGFPGITMSSKICGNEIRNESNIDDLNFESARSTAAKMIFKPDHCIGFTWPPYACRFNAGQTGIVVDPQEMRVERISAKSKVEITSGNLPKYGAALSSRFSAFEEEYNELKYDSQLLYKPIYLYMPDFLIKLKSMENRLHNSR